MLYEIYLLNINFYLFNNIIFLNKLLYYKINLLKEKNKIKKYYFKLKNSFFFFNPFYGVNIESYFNKNNNFNAKIKIKNKKITSNIYRNFKKYKIPYKDLTYIFNLSIEKIRFDEIKSCQKFVY